jgi:hypothetical protein
MSNTVVSTLTDFVAFMLPLSLLWKLQMSRRQKILLSAVFAVGLLVCIVGVVRIGYIAQLYYTSYDSTYEAYKVFGSTAIEPLLAIACASAPALKVNFCPHSFSSPKSNAVPPDLLYKPQRPFRQR